MRAKRIRSLREIEQRRKRPWLLLTVLGLIICVVVFFISYRLLKGILILEEISVRGNQVLTEEEVIKISGLRVKTSLLEISTSQIYHRLLSSSWIKEAVVRKELPNRIILWIEESRPEAIIKKEGRLYLIDEKGLILEELKEQDYLILPVLKIDYENKELLAEAISVVRAIKDLNINPGDSLLYLTGSRKEDLTIVVADYSAHEIATNSGLEDLPLNKRKVFIKIGYGNYQEKLMRLIEFAPSIRQKGLKPGLIDLRFKDRVIVKEQVNG